MSAIRQRVLAQAESTNGINQPYKPTEQYAGMCARLVEDGYLDRGAVGGFWLNDRGRRELAGMRQGGKK